MGDKDFFLSPDDAQTLGDINYMRKVKRVRRTFPKTLKNQDGFESVTEVSSVEDRSNLYQDNRNTNASGSSNTFSTPTYSFQPQPAPAPAPAPAPQPESNVSASSAKPVNVEPPKAPERRPDNSMDMFRNMARNIRKK